MIAHAETAGAIITVRYTRPSRPMQLAYDLEGLRSEYTLMTTGDPGEDAPDSSRPQELSARQTPAPIQSNGSRPSQPRSSSRAMDGRQMPPPPSRSRSIRPLTGTSARNTQTQAQTQAQSESQPPPASMNFENFESLFVPADDDGQWDVPNDDEETEDVLGWDAMGDQVRAPRTTTWSIGTVLLTETIA